VSEAGNDDWDCEFDVVVVGLGAAGSVAAIEAAERGRRVLAVDTWGRGGASARSGGVIYAGGGTPQQEAAGFADDPDHMELYLSREEGVPEDDTLLRAFCERSRDDLAWLVARGVAIAPGFDDAKAIVPTDDSVGLYFSGNEQHYATACPPVPRGHRVAGHGMTGADLVAALHETARRRGVTIIPNARLVALRTDDEGVVGADIRALPSDRGTRIAHAALYRLVDASAMIMRRVPHALTAAIERFEQRRGTPLHVGAKKAVILATGGFAYNRDLLELHAPQFDRTLPLGTPGDDGSGILCAQQLGARVRLMDHCAASRFFSPPIAFASGVLVDAHGERICDESLYAASLSARIAEHGGRAWLIVDDKMCDDARAQIRDGARLRSRPWSEIVTGRANHVVFPKLFGRINLYANRRRASTIAALARKCRLPSGALERAIGAYNQRARAHEPDELGKPDRHVQPVERPPFSAIPCHLGSIVFPAPCITLGGLDVDLAQRVKRDDDRVIPRLYAAGRCAAGIASRSYVSGLSLADCVFAGRNAGIAAASDD
jgi:3-oxo-5alpha-steroid 4-dehydrogenase